MTTANALTVERRGDLEVVMTRKFSAPKALVYRCWTEPELVRRWLGANWYPWTECEMDVRVGGKYRWAWDMGENGLMGISGEYRELVPNERIVNTERFDEAWYAGEALEPSRSRSTTASPPARSSPAPKPPRRAKR